ncbi:ribonuclease inhibitor-like [Aquarana catesbeiana]|uniref:ribonuclease inhibitor-like n=1 Tax=Aquarana catesbeiana TaxID=8400 RepID=UPI003CCA6AFF
MSAGAILDREMARLYEEISHLPWFCRTFSLAGRHPEMLPVCTRLYDNHLTDSSCPHLASGIRNNQTLRTLNLSRNNLKGPHFRDLMEALTTSRIEKLELYNNHLTDSSCLHLASGIRNNQTLRTLNLYGNNLEGPHFRDLMEALTTSWIEKLQLSSNHLTDSSCPHLASGIRNNQTLRTLDLSGNNLEGPQFRDLMEALTTSRIEELQENGWVQRPQFPAPVY